MSPQGAHQAIINSLESVEMEIIGNISVQLGAYRQQLVKYGSHDSCMEEIELVKNIAMEYIDTIRILEDKVESLNKLLNSKDRKIAKLQKENLEAKQFLDTIEDHVSKKRKVDSVYVDLASDDE